MHMKPRFSSARLGPNRAARLPGVGIRPLSKDRFRILCDLDSRLGLITGTGPRRNPISRFESCPLDHFSHYSAGRSFIRPGTVERPSTQFWIWVRRSPCGVATAALVWHTRFMTTEDVEKQFRKDLDELLKKYTHDPKRPCEIEAEDHFGGWPECGEDIRITVTIPGIWDDQGNDIRPYTTVDLGRWIRPT